MGWNDHIVVERPKDRLHPPKGLANSSLHAIAFNGISTRLNCNADTEVSKRIRNPKERTFGRTKHFRTPKESSVFPGKMKPKFRAK